MTYRFAEDGVHDSFNDEYGLDQAITEWIEFERDGADTFTLTHVSITDDARAVPHWHEIWTYREDNDAWMQAVWSHSPDDEDRELRYRCAAPWTYNRWQCHAGKAPKPFRDSGAPFGFNRTDYDYLDRENILLVTENGWIHNEHNKKVKETSGPNGMTDTKTVAYELGWITYTRVADNRCQVAIER